MGAADIAATVRENIAARNEFLALMWMSQLRLLEEYEAAQERGEPVGHGGDRQPIEIRASDLDQPPSAEAVLVRVRTIGAAPTVVEVWREAARIAWRP